MFLMVQCMTICSLVFANSAFEHQIFEKLTVCSGSYAIAANSQRANVRLPQLFGRNEALLSASKAVIR
jgi:hypothetical protein